MKVVPVALRLIGAAVVCASLGIATAGPASAACGQMDLNRDPSTYSWLNWGSYSTATYVEPHLNIAYERAVVGRYSSGTVRYYYGKNARNTDAFGRDLSKITGVTVGTAAGNYYSYNGERPRTLYRDYAPRSGWTYGC